MTVDRSNGHAESMSNPLAQPSPWWRELYQRIKLFPWWIKYNVGLTEESDLKDKIIDLASEMNLDKSWTKKIVRHAISEFSKKGLGLDYYGYHNIDHELESTYFALLSAYGHIRQNSEVSGLFDNDGVKYLFLSALFHDYDPAKQFDKPNEESVEWFLRNDPEIRKFIDLVGLDINIIIAIIYRTAYPFKGSIAENATKRIQELLSFNRQVKGDNANDVGDDSKRIEHYQRLGWFLSVCERMAGYALGDFEHANKLARSNAHALGWHPSVINEESVKYFDALKQEGEMLEFVLKGIPDNLRKNFFDNIESFENLYEKEKEIRTLTGRKEISFECRVEKIGNGRDQGRLSGLDPEVRDCVLNIYNKLPIPLKRGERHFVRSLSSQDTILITLRIKKEIKSNHENDENKMENESKSTIEAASKEGGDEYGGNAQENEAIVGYVKGGPLEKYSLRRGTCDENYGKKNTAYMEWICIKPGYWGSTGGHLLRMNFLMEAKERGYEFLTGYVHRNVISTRKSKGEIIQIVQKYDPDKLDYYRIDLSKISITDTLEDDSEFATAVYP